MVAGVHQHVLEVRLDAVGKVIKPFPRGAATCGAEPCEIVLRSVYIAREREVACFDEHLEEGVVPTQFERFAVAHVLCCGGVELVGHATVSRNRECHQPSRRSTGWHLVICTCLDGGK